MSLVEGSPVRKENQSPRMAVDVAKSIGSQMIEPGQNWQDLQQFNLTAVMEKIGAELGLSFIEWQEILIKSGSWLITGLDAQIASVQKEVREQETSIMLRQDFGLPEASIAFETFSMLAGIEARARENLKTGAQVTEQILERIRGEVLKNLALFFAMQLNQLEEKEKAYLKALEASKKETDGRQVLAEVAEISESKLNASLREMKKQKDELLSTFYNIRRSFAEKINSVFETTIFSAANQTLELTTVG